MLSCLINRLKISTVCLLLYVVYSFNIIYFDCYFCCIAHVVLYLCSVPFLTRLLTLLDPAGLQHFAFPNRAAFWLVIIIIMINDNSSYPVEETEKGEYDCVSYFLFFGKMSPNFNYSYFSISNHHLSMLLTIIIIARKLLERPVYY